MVKQSILLFLIFISSINHVHAKSKLTLTEKVNLLFEVNPKSKYKKYVIEELETYCISLKKYDKLDKKQKIKKLFKIVKKDYLSHYSLNSFFPNLFGDYTYNCVTGTALFAIIFDELNIPYTIIEVPRHVYLIAYPETEKIAVESTDFKDGIYAWSEYSMTSAINFLISIGEVSQKEVNSKGTQTIIDQHFYANSKLTFENLASLHFFNKALYFCEHEKFKSALKSLRRGNELYASDRAKLIEGSILGQLIADTEQSNIDFIEYLISFYKVSTKKVQKEQALGSFRYAISQAFVPRKDLVYTDSAEVLIHSILEDTNAQNAFIGELEFCKAYYFSIRKESKKALKSALNGYRLAPQNKIFEDIIAELIIDILAEKDIESVKMLTLIEDKENQHPYIKNVPIFNLFKINFQIYYVSDLFGDNDAEIAQIQLNKLNDMLDALDTEEPEWLPEELAIMYGHISSYHYRMANFSLALEWINKGLKLQPESTSLQNKKSYIEAKL